MVKDKSLQLFFSLVLGYLAVGAFPLLLLPKGEIVLWLNQFHNPVNDIIFSAYTHTGDGFAMAIVAVLLLLFNRKNFFIEFLLSALLTYVLVQLVFKGWIFAHIDRPHNFFQEQNIAIHFSEYIKTAKRYSFPSGHTTAAFVIATSLMLFFRKTKFAFALFLYAFFVGISRIYLAQHFYIDTYFGTILGIGIPFLSKYIISLFRKNNYERSKKGI